mmetsp:Transcript_21797/g.70379  ORF Transcript_21797/g.70379 Transcript_21797/m.70379 type:complete len:599 (-) Transcript_21797:456-2252(-)
MHAIRRSHHREQLRHLRVVGPEHLFEALEAALVRALRILHAVELVARRREPHEGLRHDRHLGLLESRLLRRLPNGARLRVVLASAFQVIGGGCRARNAHRLLRKSRRLLPVEPFLDLVRAVERVARLLVPPERQVGLAERAEHWHHLIVDGVPFLLHDVLEQGGRLGVALDGAEERRHADDGLDRVVLGGAAEHRHCVFDEGICEVAPVHLAPLDERVEAKHQSEERLGDGKVPDRLWIEERDVQLRPVFSAHLPPQDFVHGSRVRGLLGEEQGELLVHGPLLPRILKVAPANEVADRFVEEHPRLRRTSHKPVDWPAQPLDASRKRLPRHRLEVLHPFVPPQHLERFVVAHARVSATEHSERVGGESHAERAFDVLTEASDEAVERVREAVGRLHHLLRVLHLARNLLHLLDREQQVERLAGVLVLQEHLEVGRREAAAADGDERFGDNPAPLLLRERPHLVEEDGLRAVRLHVREPRALSARDYAAHGEWQRHGQKVERNGVKLRLVEAVEHYNHASEERSVDEKLYKRLRERRYRLGQLQVDVEPRMQLDAEPEQHMPQIGRKSIHPKEVVEHERLARVLLRVREPGRERPRARR